MSVTLKEFNEFNPPELWAEYFARCERALEKLNHASAQLILAEGALHQIPSATIKQRDPEKYRYVIHLLSKEIRNQNKYIMEGLKNKVAELTNIGDKQK